MSTSTIVYLALWWYCTGMFSVWFWFTRQYYIKYWHDYLMIFVLGLLGFLSWFIGYFTHGKKLGYNILGIKN